ncbi:hypothetical protein QQ045_017369 [Rhodiola kirilowii]
MAEKSSSLDCDIDWDSEDDREIENYGQPSSSTLATTTAPCDHFVGGSSGSGEASSSSAGSNSKLIQHFVGMGFPEKQVAQVIDELGDENHNLVLETLLTYSVLENTPQHSNGIHVPEEPHHELSLQVLGPVASDHSSSDYYENFDELSDTDSPAMGRETPSSDEDEKLLFLATLAAVGVGSDSDFASSKVQIWPYDPYFVSDFQVHVRSASSKFWKFEWGQLPHMHRCGSTPGVEESVDDPLIVPRKISESWKPQMIDGLPEAFCDVQHSRTPPANRLRSASAVLSRSQPRTSVAFSNKINSSFSPKTTQLRGHGRRSRPGTLITAAGSDRGTFKKITAQVTGELHDHLTCWDALRAAALPVGTVSGAPKVKAMELIDELEGNITSLLHLSLAYNQLEGSIPLSLKNCVSLGGLYLAYNKFSGVLAGEVLGNFPRMIYLILDHNSFSGNFPREVGNLVNVVGIDISSNNFSGEIPSELGSCVMLDSLRMANNSFDGSIPLALEKLTSMRFLDLSYNNLSGRIPWEFQRLAKLEIIDVSFNQLEGEVPIHGAFSNSIHKN